MNEKEARYLIDTPSYITQDEAGIFQAKGYLEAIEKVKGLVEALKYYRDLDRGLNPKKLPKGCVVPLAYAALAKWEKEK